MKSKNFETLKLKKTRMMGILLKFLPVRGSNEEVMNKLKHGIYRTGIYFRGEKLEDNAPETMDDYAYRDNDIEVTDEDIYVTYSNQDGDLYGSYSLVTGEFTYEGRRMDYDLCYERMKEE